MIKKIKRWLIYKLGGIYEKDLPESIQKQIFFRRMDVALLDAEIEFEFKKQKHDKQNIT